MKVKVFVKSDCPRCPEAKALAESLEDIEVYDVDNVEGLAEAAFYSVLTTPSFVLTDETGKEIKAWLGVVPNLADLELVS
ncbi:MAG: thioredoxin family protein [Actinomycetota bacterium]|nr:thioredoxin family protein [Actinomycetota bacterium]